MAEKKNHDCGCEHEHDNHECDCGCEHDEDCDCGCDDNVVMLQDADGNEVAFNYVYNMEHEGKEYVFLQAADADEDDGEIEIFAIHTVEEDGQYYDMLDPVDDALYDVLYEKLLLVAAEDACEDDCDCDDCDCDDDHCDCGCHHDDDNK